MRQVLALLMCVAGFAGSAAAEPLPEPAGPSGGNDCEHFLGEWVSETPGADGKSTRIESAIYRRDGKLQLSTAVRSENGELKEEQVMYRDWYCDGNVYITRNDPEVEEPGRRNGPQFKVYQLLETSKNLIRYRAIVGDSPGAVYTLERTDDGK